MLALVLAAFRLIPLELNYTHVYSVRMRGLTCKSFSLGRT
jgi:hypothetical protein